MANSKLTVNIKLSKWAKLMAPIWLIQSKLFPNSDLILLSKLIDIEYP